MTARTGLATVLELIGHDRTVELLSRDEHLRYPLYVAALAVVGPDRERELLAIVLADPDPAMRVSAVLGYLDRLGGSRSTAELAAWRAAHDDLLSSDELLLRRADEWVVLAAVRDERPLDPAQLVDASDWLQRRLSEQLVDPDALALLAADGRTKRIRNVAARRLRELRPR